MYLSQIQDNKSACFTMNLLDLYKTLRLKNWSTFIFMEDHESKNYIFVQKSMENDG